MHIDLNAFFATCEEIKNPELIGKPVIVCSESGRGVVSTASYKAREFGVHSAMPYFEAKRLCPEGIFVKPDFAYYEMMSRSFFSFLKRYSLFIEEASIDEGYVDMTEACKHVADPKAYFQKIMDDLLKEIGLKCSIGVAPTKFLAKMASDMKKPLGLTFLYRRSLNETLYPLPIESFFGIGKKTSAKLKDIGIMTIGDLKKKVDQDDEEIKTLFGKYFLVIKEEINGYGDDVVDPTPYDPKSLGHSETFPYDTNEEYIIKNKLKELSMEVSEGVKRERKKGKTVVLVVKDSDFSNHNKSMTLSEGTDDDEIIFETVSKLYDSNYLGVMLRLVGVTLQNLYNPSEETVQMNIWNFEEYEKMDETKLLVNELNRKMKKPALKIASEVNKKNGNQ